MNVFQKILKSITFGAYNPERKFENEVLNEVTGNLERIEGLRNNVEQSVGEYNKSFPHDVNFFEGEYGLKRDPYQNFELQAKIDNVIKNEEELQELGKYRGMDEQTRIKAILSEGESAKSMKMCDSFIKHSSGVNLSNKELEAYRISEYYSEMGGTKKEYKEVKNPSDSTGIDTVINMMDILTHPISTLKSNVISAIESDKLDNINNEGDVEKYIAMIMANDRATRQNDGTEFTKTQKEWKKFDKDKEKTLREMPEVELISQGSELEKNLKERYEELMTDKEDER